METNTEEGQANPRTSAVFRQDLDDLHRRSLKELVHGTSGPVVHFLNEVTESGKDPTLLQEQQVQACLCYGEEN